MYTGWTLGGRDKLFEQSWQQWATTDIDGSPRRPVSWPGWIDPWSVRCDLRQSEETLSHDNRQVILKLLQFTAWWCTMGIYLYLHTVSECPNGCFRTTSMAPRFHVHGIVRPDYPHYWACSPIFLLSPCSWILQRWTGTAGWIICNADEYSRKTSLFLLGQSAGRSEQ